MTRPILLGHRGARAFRHIPENTLASFELCLQQGCDGFEFDVRRSADGQPVICHDATIGGMKIENTASKSLALLLPTLEDVLRQFAYRAFLDIELKVAGLEPQTLAELRKHPPQKGYVVSSFLPEVLAAIHDLDPAIPLGFLCETQRQLRGWRQTPAEWVIPQFKLADGELVELVHAAGKRIMVWTVNRAERMREFAAWGVDAILSDETELLVRSLR
ncbi:MAG: glycerophosphodiester phosphodiesterase [Terriglobales bacterium]|jgi:glycerophosphoryl diester phosphodiesterase